MTFALTNFEAYGIEIDEPLTTRFKQYAVFEITGANTNVAYDLGTFTASTWGTFWTAVKGTDPGTTALKAMADIQVRAKQFLSACGGALTDKAVIPNSRTEIVTLTGTTTGGAASETVTVTGAVGTDVLVGAMHNSGGTATVGVVGGTPGSGTIATLFTANPGASAVITYFVLRTVTAVNTGTYEISMDSTNTNLPNILFKSGDAPTSAKLILSWELKDNETPVKVRVNSSGVY